MSYIEYVATQKDLVQYESLSRRGLSCNWATSYNS